MIGKAMRYPEWKALYDAIWPLIEGGQKEFRYEDLDRLSGLDIRSDRGRGQFYRFRKELLQVHQLWLENVSGSGYVVIQSKDQPQAAFKRVKSARRKVQVATSIATNVRMENLTSEERPMQVATATILHELSKTFHSVGHKFKLASQSAMTVPGVDLPKLLGSLDKKKKKPARQ